MTERGLDGYPLIPLIPLVPIHTERGEKGSEKGGKEGIEERYVTEGGVTTDPFCEALNIATSENVEVTEHYEKGSGREPEITKRVPAKGRIFRRLFTKLFTSGAYQVYSLNQFDVRSEVEEEGRRGEDGGEGEG